MGKFKFSAGSLEKLKGLDHDLVAVVKRGLELSQIDFSVTYGMRTVKEQEQILKDGKSTTKNSRHLTGHAVDLTPWVNGKSVNGDDPASWVYFADVARALKLAAVELKVKIEWGGDWKTFKDGYHFQIPWDLI